MHSVHAVTGDRLRAMRTDAGLSQYEAVRRFNELAESEGLPERLTPRALRRWELLHTPAHSVKLHGSTPPTLRELYLLLAIYDGSPSYLLLGIDPPRYPLTQAELHKGGMFRPEMLELMNLMARWSQAKQVQFIEFIRQFIR